MPTIREGTRSGHTPSGDGRSSEGPLYALVLAAGAGTRFGGGKLHAHYREGRLVDAALRAALAAPVVEVIVVVQPEDDAVLSGGRVRLHVCADWAEGMAASLSCGVAALPKNAAGAFVFLGDMPQVPAEILPALAQAVWAGAPAALPTCEGRDGHPVVFAARVFPQLLALTGDSGARRVVVALGDEVVRIATTDTGVLLDVDTPEDLDRLRAGAPPPIASA